MAELQFTGNLTEIKEVKTGTTKKGDEWANVDFEVTESNPKNADYPQIGLFSYFKSGEYCKYSKDFKDYFKLGDEVIVTFNLKKNVYTKKDGSGQGVFYKTDAWKVGKLKEEEQEAAQVYNASDKPDDLPF